MAKLCKTCQEKDPDTTVRGSGQASSTFLNSKTHTSGLSAQVVPGAAWMLSHRAA